MAKCVMTCAAAALSLSAGCKGGQPLPKMYPANGKVMPADGRPVTAGLVQFTPRGSPDVTTSGEIGPDGSFTLSSVVGNRKVAGATAGPHTVTVLPPLAQPSQEAMKGGPPQPVTLRELVTVKADAANTFTLTLPEGR
jgi:hypothetical protein